MKDTIYKDKRRATGYQIKASHYECWNLSKRYSGILMKNLDSRDLYTICRSISGEYLNELTGNNLSLEGNHIQVWQTMINTVKKGDHSIASIRLLHQTNCQRAG